MSTDGTRKHWDEVYATKPDNEVSWHEPVPRMSLDMIAATGLPRTAAILDVGGGLSRLTDHLIADGYHDLTVLDISDEAIRRLHERHGPESPVTGVVADITTWRPQQIYDIWHDRAVLHFLTTEADQAAYRTALLAALRPGGHAVIATFAPTGPERCSGLPVQRYGFEELSRLLGGAFRLCHAFELDHATPGGRTQRFHVGRFERLR